MNNEAIKQKTNELAELLRNSDEHRIYLDAKTRAYGNESTRRLLDEYRILQTRVQAGTLAGADCREEMTKLQKNGRAASARLCSVRIPVRPVCTE